MGQGTLKVEEILEKIDIVEIVSEYVKLKKSGKNYKALCPFHQEKTPSFFVNSEKQIFHCFGCGIGGNAIKFLMNIEKISFYEALNIIAKKAGVEIVKIYDVNESVEKKKIIKANEYTSNFYNKMLFSSYGKRALEYLYQRNLNDEHINKFMIGFAPSGNFLLSKINQDGLNKEDFILACLLDEEGKEDVFKNRIMFPIYNMKNEIIGFGGRAIDDDVMPKYLNIRENILFNKSSCLYGINWGKENIKTTGFAILVEGYFDVLKMHINGIENVIAPMGTAISELHLNNLRKLTEKILLIFDGDDAGIRACMRNLESILRNGFDSKICMLPAGFDPDKFIDEYGIESLKNFIERSQDFIDFSISIYSQIYDMENPKEKSIVIKGVLKLISNITDEIERYEFLKKLSEKMEIKMDILEESLQDIIEKKLTDEYTFSKKFSDNNLAENLLIEIILNDKNYWGKLVKFKGELTERIEKIISIGEKLLDKGIEINPSFLISECQDDEFANLISSIAIKEETKIPENKKEKIFKDCLKKVREKKFLSEIENYKKRMREKLEKGDDCSQELKEIERLHYRLNQLKKE
ncbi:MAG: DNA primase [Candidatus Omnitrophica bacterium]|nr:DNA primase [Candidatus Omnitrophota bacterium]